MSDWNKQIIEEFRNNEGRVGGPFAGKPLLLLHTTGAKSGQERINPLATFMDGDRLVVIASKGGAPTNPDWYYNVVANPRVEVEYGTKQFAADAAVAQEPERSRLYAKMEEVNPGFTAYRQNTDRVIPVVTLTPLN